ncbi:hypothetical protein Aperf_G00000064035 [Anoplocephala perfoliata]
MSDSFAIKELFDSHSGAQEEAPSELNHSVDGDKPSQEHQNPTEQHLSSPEIVLSQSPRAEAFDEVVEAAKARDISRLKVIIDSLSDRNYAMNPESGLNSLQSISNSPKDSVSSNQLTVTGSVQNSTEASQIPSTDSVSIPSSPPSATSQQASSSVSPPANETSKPGEEQKVEETGVVRELTGPPLPPQVMQPNPVEPTVTSTSSVVHPAAPPAFNSAIPLPIKPFDISTCLEVSAKVAVCSTSGDLAPIPLKHPDYPSILLHLKTVPPATYGQMINLSFSTQWILSRLCQLLEANPSANGSPIVLPLSISLNSATPAVEMQPPQPQQIPSLSSLQNNPPKSITLPLQPQTSVTSAIQQQPAPVKPISGARKMRAIAPKPATSNSLPGGLSMNSVSIRSSASRPARKIISGPLVAPNALSLQNSSSAAITPATTLVNPGTLVNNAGVNSNSRSASSMLRKAANSPTSRNRNRRKNPTTSFPIVAVSTLPQVQSSVPVAITTNTTTIVPPSGGYIVDPTTGALISADATTVSGGFIQPIMHPGPNGTQFFAAPGPILVGASNGGIIPMPIGGVIPAEPKSADAETGELLANPQNSYQSTFLVPADGSSEGFSQQVFFTNGGAPNGQFILPSYQTTAVPSGEYVQSFQTQSTDYIQTNGNEFYFTDGSCYMPYSTLIGQAQPVATVEIKEDGSTVDIQPDGEDILDVAMRVAREGSGPNMTETVTLAPTIELTDEANSALNDFMQSSAVDPNAEYGDHQQIEQVNVEESVLGADQQTSTGDAKIDALLAEAALVSSVNGVGDDQSAVSVPVTSLLAHRVGTATTTMAAANNNDACTIVEAATNCTDMNEFPQALYDSFVNFDSSIIQDTLPASSTAAATEAAFTYVTQQVGDLDADFGATTVDLDVTSSHVADSFLKDLATQVDEMSAELAAKEEAQKSSGDQNESEGVSVEADGAEATVPHFGEREDGASQPDDMEDILRAVNGVPCDDDDDPVSFFLTREYDVDDFGLLDPTNETNVSPPRVPDDINEQNEASAVPIVPDGISTSAEVHISPNNSALSSSGLLHPVEDTTLNESLISKELDHKNATMFESSPSTKRMQSPNPAVQESNPINHDAPDESDDDDSGSELDFLPSREKSMENHPAPGLQLSSSVPAKTPKESVAHIEPHHSLRPLNTVSSPQPFRKSPRTPKQSTPRTKTGRRSSTSSALSPPRRRSNRRTSRGVTHSGNSSTPVSPRRHLRSSTAAARRKEETDSIIILSDDDEALELSSNVKNESGNLSPNNVSKLETTLDTEPFMEESTLLCMQESQLQSPKGRSSRTPSILSSSMIDTGGQAVVSGSTSTVWNINADRPRSFGLIGTEVSALLPVNNISEAQLELRDNPVLQSNIPFWGDPNVYPTSDDTSTEGGCQGERQPDSVGTSDDSDADSMLSLQAAVRAASFALNVQFSSPLTLPRDDKTFSRFAETPSLQSFETLAPSNNLAQSTAGNTADSCAPAICSPYAGSADNDEDSSEGTITPNSCIPDPASLSFSETLFPPKFPSPTISMKPPSMPILKGCRMISTSFSAIAEAAANPPKMTNEILTAAPQEEVTVEESLCSTEHPPLQCEVVPSTSLVSPVAKMVASTSDDIAQSIGEDSAPVEIIDLPASVASNENAPAVETASSEFKQPLKMKIVLSSVLKRDKEKSKKKKNKKTSLKRKSEENLQDSISAPSPPKLQRLTSKFLISRVGDSFCGKTIESGSAQIEDRPILSAPSSLPLLKPFQPPVWAAVKPTIRERYPSNARGRPRRGVSRGAKVHVARPTPPTVVDGRNSSESPETLQQSLEPPAANVGSAGAGRKFFCSSKEDRRSSAITKTRPWRHSFGGVARKRGRFSGSLNIGDRRNSQSQHQSMSTFQSSLSLSALPGTNITSPTELRVRIRVNKDDSSGQPSGNSQAGSEQLQAAERESTIVTSNADEEEEMEDEEEGNEAGSGPEIPAQPVFFVAPEAETFVDKNQARIRLVVNRPACVANGIDPGNADDDTEDDEEEEDDEGNGGNTGFSPSHERIHRHLPPSDKPPRSQGTSEPQQSSYHSHQPTNQPHNYTSQTPAFNHQPAVFSPLRCDMGVSSTAAQQHQPTNRTSADALGSARSSSTTSGSLPAPSTISPAPFTLPPTINNEAENNDQNFYQRQQQSRQFSEARVERQTPPLPSAYHHHQQQQQQHPHQAIAAAYAAMVANTFLTQQVLMPPYSAYSQQQQEQSRGHLEHHSNPIHHQQQEQRHQRTAIPSYRGESGSNEAHQQQHPCSLTPNFSNLVPDSDALNYYPWNTQQYQHPMYRQNPMRSNERYYSASSPSQHTSSNLPVGVPTASQWYQGTAHSSANPGQSATSQAPNPASGYPQLDDSAVVAAVAAAGYRLSPFSRLS